MYSPYDNVDPRPMFELINTIDRLADKCELDRSMAWDHPEPAEPFEGEYMEIDGGD